MHKQTEKGGKRLCKQGCTLSGKLTFREQERMMVMIHKMKPYQWVLGFFLLLANLNEGQAKAPLRTLDLASDTTALLQFAQNITGLNWSATLPITDWDGVVIASDSSVVALELSGLDLSGTLPTAAPADASALERLKRIDLSNNRLSGDLESTGAFFGALDSLRYLNLSENDFTGNTPTELTNLSLLDTLDIAFNRIDSLPDFSAGTATLNQLAADSNSLTFGSLEPNDGIADFTYQNQDSIQETIVIDAFEGESFEYTITTTGSADEYVWFSNGVEYSTGARLFVANITNADSGRVFIAHVINTIITDLTLYRRPVILDVKSCPRSNTIAGDTSICQGDAAVIPISEDSLDVGDATGAQFSWEVSSDSITFEPLNDDGGNPVTSRNFTSSNFPSTRYFRRILSTTQCRADTSNVVKVNVLPVAQNTVTPLEQTVCLGQNADTVFASAQDTAGVFSIQWQYSGDGENWRDTLSLDTETFLFEDMTDTTFLRRIVSGGCAPDTSQVAVINVQPALDSNQVFQDQVVCDNSLPRRLSGTTPVGGTGTYTYSWQVQDTVINNEAFWREFGTNSFYQPDSIRGDTLIFRRVVYSGCDSLISNAVRLLPAVDLGENTIEADYTIVCRGGELPLFRGNAPEADPETFTYIWQTTLDLNTWESRDSTQNYDPNDSLFTENFFIRRIFTDSCQDYISNVLRIRIVDSLRNNEITAPNREICAGDTSVTIALNATVPQGGTGEYEYLWQISFDSTSWADQDTTATISQAAPLPRTAQFRRIVFDSCFSDTSNIIEINVLQFFGENTISANNQRICLGDSGISLIGTPPSVSEVDFSYRWQSSTDSIRWFPVVDTSVQNLEIDTFFLDQTTYFRRLVLGGCTPDTSNVIQIEVVPTPQNNFISGAQTICAGTMISPLVGARPIGAADSLFRVEWQASTDSLDWLPVGDSLGGLESIVLGDTTFFRRVLRLSDFCPPSFSNVLQVNVLQLVTNNDISSDQSICLGDSAQEIRGPFPNGSDTLPTFRWQVLPFGDSVWTTVSSLQNYRPRLPQITTQYRRIVLTNCENDTSNVVTIQVSRPVEANTISGAQVICIGEPIDTLFGVDLADSVDFPPPFSYQWQISGDRNNWLDLPNAQDVNYIPSPQDSTVYFRRLVTTDCEVDSSNVLTIRGLPLPNVDAGLDTVVFVGESVRLQATGALRYYWRPAEDLDDDSIANPTATPRFTTEFVVFGTDRNNCTNTDTVEVRVIDQPQLRGVDAITPNGDGLNEFFVLEGIGNYPNSTLIVFDRRGKEVYRREGYQNDWDGTYNGNPLPAGVYYYLVKFAITNRTVKGSFMILD